MFAIAKRALYIPQIAKNKITKYVHIKGQKSFQLHCKKLSPSLIRVYMYSKIFSTDTKANN